MRPSPVFLNAAKKSAKQGISLPVELTPLFAAVAVAVASGCYFTYRKFKYDRQLRLGKTTPNLSALDEVLNEAAKEGK